MRPASRFILTILSSFYQAAPPSRYFHDNLAGTTEVQIKISARTSHREMPARHDIGNNRRKRDAGRIRIWRSDALAGVELLRASGTQH
ncbi:hypothetical protein ACCS64_38180, partial [Rhizobium ruizarguesonis]